MEIFRRLGFGKKETSLPGPVRDQFEKGQETVRTHGLNEILDLTGNDKTLLELIVGLRLLNSKIDDSKITLLGKSRYAPGIYGVQKATSTTRRYLQQAEEVKGYIDGYIAEKYKDNLNRARNIQLAVGMLFAQTHYRNVGSGSNEPWDKTTITAWATEWKDRIEASAH